MSTRRERANKRNSWIGRLHAGLCPNCGEKGPHFVPPSFGDPGFYICDRKHVTDPAAEEAPPT